MEPSPSKDLTRINSSEQHPSIQSNLQRSTPERTSTDMIIESNRKNDECREAHVTEISETSRNTSMSWEEKDAGDSDETAVNSTMPSSANSVYHLNEKRSDLKDVNLGQETEESYHVFTTKRKKQIVWIVSLAGLFSPLSSNIYFPAMGRMSRYDDYSGTKLTLN